MRGRVEKWERGGQSWEQDLGSENCPYTAVDRCGPERQSASEPPCLGTKGACAPGTETAPLCLQLQDCLHLGAQSRLRSLWDKARLGHIRLLWCNRTSSFLGNSGPQTTVLSPRTSCSDGPHSLGTTGLEHLVSGNPQDQPQHPAVFLQAPVLFSQ